VVVLLVVLEVLRQTLDAGGEERHLDFARARVGGLALELADDLFPAIRCDHAVTF
jgi:hypothetical protein